MNKIITYSFALFMLLGLLCNAQNNKQEVKQKASLSKVEVYYFHFTRRCSTCLAVEENAKKAVETLYADKIKSGEYSFQGINLDEDKSKALAERLKVEGQTLLVICGNNKVDLTDKAFMIAHDTDKMKEEIKKAVEKVTKG